MVERRSGGRRGAVHLHAPVALHSQRARPWNALGPSSRYHQPLLGPGHDRIAFQIRLWILAYAVNIAWSLAASFARCIGKPWIEVWTLASTVIASVSLALWTIPRFGTAGAIVALGLGYGVGFVTFAAISWRSGIPFGSWIRRELVPRAMVGSLVVGVCDWVLTTGPLSVHLPPPGWTHGAFAVLLFLPLFAISFLLFGDTQRLSRMVWQMAGGALTRRSQVPSS